MTLSTPLSLCLPLALAAALTLSAAPVSSPEAASAAIATSGRRPIIRSLMRELDGEQRWRLMAELARLRSDDRPIILELMRSESGHLDPEALLDALASSGTDSEALTAVVWPIVDAGLSWLDGVVQLEPRQRERLRHEWTTRGSQVVVSMTGRFGSLGFGDSEPPFDQDTRAAFREFRRAVASEAANQQDIAQPLRRAVLDEGIEWATQVKLVLDEEQEQAIRDAILAFGMLPRDQRQDVLCQLASGIDDVALQSALQAFRDAEPVDRPAAMHAVVDVIAAGVTPTLFQQFAIAPVQQAALGLARDRFSLGTDTDRGELSSLREERRESAWATLSSEEQALLTAARDDLRERARDWRNQVCQ